MIVALGLAALRSASEMWAGVTFLATCECLGLAAVGVICRGGDERAWWLGFAVFGWGYLAIFYFSRYDSLKLPTSMVLEVIRAKLDGQEQVGLFLAQSLDPSFAMIGHCLWALLAAVLGGVLAGALFAFPASHSQQPAAEAQAAIQEPRLRWPRPVVIGLVVVSLVAFGALVGATSALTVWAGATFQLTCGLLGLAALGALLARGKTREIGLGATLFGFGYMYLAFGWYSYPGKCPYLATGQFLEDIRPWLPPHVSGFPVADDRTFPANARILETLERPIPFRFPTKTPLEDVLKHLRTVTQDADGEGIRVYVDPVGLQEAEKSMTSTVVLDVTGVPLKTSLHICLKQLGLAYIVKAGFLMISSREAVWPLTEDSFLTVGHCLFALIAAAFGGAAAPIVAGRRGSS